ncbi:hypothetical protein NLU13_0866 [Sarocladium strictum]|uniref:Ferric oxidoreductase domain-containing protein n=1 Tax=Sarocladium strictum TaxID=5046 RepID=A0AA39GPV3_SARSR|nr:hypothetical protein NLU13_0866 [Sarocladium strictum]
MAVVPLEGYGREEYGLMCATACAWKMPYTIDCPEFANMTEEERAEAYPSPSCFASNTPYLTSLAWCIHSYCPKNTSLYEIEKFWEKDMIYEATSLLYSYPEALAKVDPDHPPAPLSPDETVFNRTISMEDSMWEASFNGVREYGATSKNESTYSLVIILGSVFMPIILSFLRFLPFPASARRRFNAYFIDPPAWGKKHLAPILGLGLVPTRGQALFILYIILINAVATFDGYPDYQPNGFLPDRHYALMRFIGNRAGTIAFVNVAVLILYAGRNSLLLALTNWSHSTFLLLHRWVATICVIQVVLHSLLWLRIMIEQDSYAEAVKEEYWIWGIVATVMFSMFLPFSALPVRKILYEVFLIVHICLSVMAIVGSWYHIWYLYEGLGGYEIWLILASVFWGCERLVRLVRISRHGVKRAYVTRIDDKYLRVDIPDVDAHGHCFVYFPTLSWRVWENHPFSIVNYSSRETKFDSGESSETSSQIQPDQGAEGLASKETGIVATNSPVSTAGGDVRPGVTLFVQVMKGFTTKLAKKADTGSSVPVLIECSYGYGDHLAPTSEYPNTVVIAGGVGIAGVLSALKSSFSIFSRPAGTTKLYWGIKQRGLVDAVKYMILGEKACEAEAGNGSPSKWGHFDAHVTIGSRMDIKQVITSEVESSVSGVTVIVCGPAGMCDDARVVCSGLARHGAKVRYVEEAFSW